MTSWREFEAELDAWADAGLATTFWWRDDDATAVTPALRRLLEVSSGNNAPVAVAVIPAGLEAGFLDDSIWPAHARLLQHGLAHRNHAPADEKKSEFGPHRPIETMIADVSAGLEILSGVSRFLRAFVPPWNRTIPEVVAALPGLGLRGVSTHGPRRERSPTAGLIQSNTHVDPIDWRGDRGYLGDETVLDQVVGHLRARRTGTVDREEPTGLLTHHLVHDKACWRFVERFVASVSAHAGAVWLGAEEVFAA